MDVKVDFLLRKDNLTLGEIANLTRCVINSVAI